MTAPLARCAGDCASIAQATFFEKALICAGLALLAIGAIAAIVTLLDTPDRRHSTLHRIRKSKSCGRCADQLSAAHHDKEMDASALRGPVALSIRKERANG